MRRIARTITAWRTDRDLKAGDVAQRVGWSASKQSKLENAAQAITPADVMTLALYYDIPEEDRNKVFHDALAAQQPDWWEAISKDALVQDVRDYIELESEASELHTFEIDLVHGLLQTPEYAEALGKAYIPRSDADTKRARVIARANRQVRLTGEDHISVKAVLAEGALRLVVGGPSVMRAQLDRLLELAALDHIQIRVLAACNGAYPSMGTSFAMLSFVDGAPDVGYIETLQKGVYLEQPGDVEPYKLNFAGLWDVALDEAESIELISTIAASLER
jgi:transcriptional regulator with XRE-family HTH domain